MRRRVAVVLALVSLGSLALGARPPEPAGGDLERQFAATVRPFLDTYCVTCHGGANPAAQFDLRTYTNLDAVTRDHAR